MKLKDQVMKKPSSKSTKLSTSTPAAAKSLPPAAAKSLPVAAPKVAAAASAKPVRVELPKKAVAAAVPAKKPVVKNEAPAVVATKVSTSAKSGKSIVNAKIDIGFGNTLFIRGEGAGLSWDKGIAMDNVSADEWRISLSGATAPVVFKFLVNDLTWSAGEDYTVAAGDTVMLVPTF